MKRFVKMIAVLFVITWSTWSTPQKAAAQSSLSFQLFYDQLSPYGSWVSYPNYGYVWLPNAGPGFSPYATAGHWIFTEYGWTWVSDYAWGWAAFHYGRWLLDPYYGWLWVPDNIWGPAWVVWRSSPNYYGWAPLRPGISINVAFGPHYNVQNDWWVFAPCSHINSHNIYNYYAPRTNNVTIIKNTTIINRTYVNESEHTTYSYGPDRDGAQKATGNTINTVPIKNRTTPGENVSNGQLSIYKPRVEKTYANGSTPVPKILNDLKEVKKRDEKSDVSSLQNQQHSSTAVKPLPPSKQAPEKHQELPSPNNNVKQPNNGAQPKHEPKTNVQPKQGNMLQLTYAQPSGQPVAQAAKLISNTEPQETVSSLLPKNAKVSELTGQLSASNTIKDKVNPAQVRQQTTVSYEKKGRVNISKHNK